MFKDYYKILNITCPSSADEIKKAYREQAMRWHPDRNPGRDTTAKMQDVVEAYYVLGNAARKIRYDAEYELYMAAYTKRASEHSQHSASSDYQAHNPNLRQDMSDAQREAAQYVREFFQSLKQNGQVAAKGAWEELKKWLVILLVFFILGLIVSLCVGRSVNESLSDVANFSEEIENAASVKNTDTVAVPENWCTYSIGDAFNVSVPKTLELRQDFDAYTKMLNSFYVVSKDAVVFQQKGLSDNEASAFHKYCRIICQHFSASPGDLLHCYETLPLVGEDREFFVDMARNELAQGISFIGPVDVQWVTVNNVKAVRVKYKRQGSYGYGPVVCQIYVLFNYKEMAKVILSYRESESDIWKSDIDKVMSTFQWKIKY